MSEAGVVRLRVERRGGRSTVTCCGGAAPLTARVVHGSRIGFACAALVQTAGGPVGGDRLRVDVEVGADARLELSTIAATVVHPGRDAARLTVRGRVESGGRLVWRAGWTVVCPGSRYESDVAIDLADGAAAVVREAVIRGRHGEAGGGYVGRLRCDLGGAPLLRDAVVIDPGSPELDSAAALGGARAYGCVALLGLAGTGGGEGECVLAGPGALTRALALDAIELERRLAAAERAYLGTLHPPQPPAAIHPATDDRQEVAA